MFVGVCEKMVRFLKVDGRCMFVKVRKGEFIVTAYFFFNFS